MVSQANREAFIKYEAEHGRTENEGIARLVNYIASIASQPNLIQDIESMITKQLQQ